MNTMADQVAEIAAAYGHVDQSTTFGESRRALDAKAMTPDAMVAGALHSSLLTKDALYAQAVRWTAWYVDAGCGKPLKVETDATGTSVMHAGKDLTLPSLRDVSLREGFDGMALKIIAEITRCANEAMTSLMAGSPHLSNMSDIGGHLSGGNSEGVQLVAEALITLFAAIPAGTPDKNVKLRAMRIGNDVRAGMKHSFMVEKIVDAMVLAHVSPFDAEDADTDQARLVMNKGTMAALKGLGQINRERGLAAKPAMGRITEALSAISVQGQTLTPAQILESVSEAFWYPFWQIPDEAMNAAGNYGERVKFNPFKLTPVQRITYVALTAFGQWHRKDDVMMTKRLGCPLHHTGKFGKWYKHVAGPMTDWYLQQRAFQAQGKN